MRKKTLTLISSITLLLVAGYAIIALTSARAANEHTQALPPPRTNRGIANPYPPGIPAITPHLNTIPSFTAADAQQFITTNGFAGGTISPGSSIVIEKTLFITSSQASSLIGESVDRPANALVCFVQLYGPFVVSNDPPAGVQQTMTVPRVYELFDAQTGNLLGYGGLP